VQREYVQPKVSRKIGISSLGVKNMHSYKKKIKKKELPRFKSADLYLQKKWKRNRCIFSQAYAHFNFDYFITWNMRDFSLKTLVFFKYQDFIKAILLE